ncbi:short-chain dehydrogenase/reductase SDR [Kribbella flavida DSM 17836]|uniref:Short-chain dehydrogenase/reductase SDR n=1 Tax=Kribbella flavida (strain DSM 17836 / JCM 10339 / NBRC 14399) TaxID=479435 RepID=D2PRE2_KRIFD|nr:SDR family oxidoreductase [Kribbella flavida]ADB34860.1 short-chain dehydrogenase/reductase SDR [Kribbella flavida DSM 17836]
MKVLEGKLALVTGGSRGIGAATAVALAEAGADVALTYQSADDAAAAVVKQIEALGQRGFALRADAADSAAVDDAVARAAGELGGLDIFVNNAGVGTSGMITDVELAEVDRVITVNVRGAYVAARAAASRLADGGRMIHVGSCIANRNAGPGMTLYALSKSALVGMSKGLARDLGPRGITSNVVQPGPTDTAMNPADGPYAAPQLSHLALDRFGTPQEVAAAVVYLAGPTASYVTGTELTIDGGHSA